VPRNSDAVLLESVSTHRRRLRQAFLLGRLADRRQVNDNVKRLIGSIVLAAVAGVGCLGYSFVTTSLAKQAAATAATSSPFPTPSPTPTGSRGRSADQSTTDTSTTDTSTSTTTTAPEGK
jgi:hypothetical protein